MLDYMRRNALSIVIVFVLGVLILAFVIEFGPQSKGCQGDGPGGQRSARTVMKVLGYEVTDLEFELWRSHAAMQPGLSLGGQYMPCYLTAKALASFGAEGADAVLPETPQVQIEVETQNVEIASQLRLRLQARGGVNYAEYPLVHDASRAPPEAPLQYWKVSVPVSVGYWVMQVRVVRP